jgi:hypothetical protein
MLLSLTRTKKFGLGAANSLQSPKIEAEVFFAPAPNRTQGVDGSLVQNFEFGATFPLADSLVIRMKWIYLRESASDSLVGHDDTT